jgi:sterol desaturase/sphingolipid hydroxylase (fatty acid hydroxylase superfamily)
MLEHQQDELLSRRAFLRRQAVYTTVALGIVLGSLLVGMLGYHGLEGMPWIDAFLNAAMLLGGMGQVGELRTAAGKIFAGAYALYCGVVLLVVLGVLFTPLIHRFLHRFHLELDDGDKPKRGTKS